jgi:hypothetical protein
MARLHGESCQSKRITSRRGTQRLLQQNLHTRGTAILPRRVRLLGYCGDNALGLEGARPPPETLSGNWPADFGVMHNTRAGEACASQQHNIHRIRPVKDFTLRMRDNHCLRRLRDGLPG